MAPVLKTLLLLAALSTLAGCISPNGPHNCWGSCYSERQTPQHD